MAVNFSENKLNIGQREKSDSQIHDEIVQLRRLLDLKEKELKTSLKTSSLKKEILSEREKIYDNRAEHGKGEEKTDLEKEMEIKAEKEAPEKNFEELNMTRKSAPTKLQITKITKQMKDADIAHQLIVLIDLIRFKGVYYAVKIAKKLGNAYLLDRLHDAIVNDLYEDLIKNKKLRP